MTRQLEILRRLRSGRGGRRRALAAALASALLTLSLPLFAGATAASAAGSVTLFAFPGGTSAGPGNSSCTANTSTAADCSLQDALTTSEGYPGETVTIVMEYDATAFVGSGYTLDLEGSSVYLDGSNDVLDASTSPPGSGPILSVTDSVGGGSLSLDSATFTGGSASDGAALDIATSDVVTISSVNFTDNVAQGNGGAIDVVASSAGTLNLNFDRFTNNYAARDGGAVDVADGSGSETVNSDSSYFAHDVAGRDGGAIDLGDHGASASLTDYYSSYDADSAGANGGAIDLGDHGGGGSLTTTSLTLAQNVASGDGGAIDVADDSGNASITDASSTFSGNAANVNGGAIDAADFGGAATVNLTGSTFTGNSANLNDVSGVSEAGDGGAIDLADGEATLVGSATATIASATFTNNTAYNCGGALDSADSGSAHVTIASSSFVDNSSTTGNGGAINTGDAAATGVTSLVATGSVFTGNSGGSFGGAIANADAVGAGSALLGVESSYFADNASTQNGLAGGAISNGTYGGTGVAIVLTSTFKDNGELGGVDYPDRGSALMNGSTGQMYVLRDTLDAGPVLEAPIYDKATLDIAGTIVAGQSPALCQSVGGTIASEGYNLEQDASSCGFSPGDGQSGDLNSSNPHFGSLLTSGATPYEPVGESSAAAAAIPSGFSAAVLTSSLTLCQSPDVDQTGTTTVTGPCAIGAVDAPWANPTSAVTYDLGGGAGSAPTQANEPSGAVITLAGASGITRAGYSFAGWSDGASTYLPGATYTIASSDVHFTAQWTPVPHHVSYSLGGGTGTLPAPISVSTGATFVVAGASGISRAGYAFAGWSDGVATYGSGATYSVGSADVVLSATWTKTPVAVAVAHRVSFAAGGARGTLPPTRSVLARASFTVPSANSLTRPGDVFAGWSDGHGLFVPGDRYVMGVRAVVLTATWTPVKHEVRFAAGGARGAVPLASSWTAGSDVALPGASSLTRPGYVFTGWSDGHRHYLPGATFLVPGTNVTLTATWTPRRPAHVSAPSCTLYFAVDSSSLTAADAVTLSRCASAIATSGQRVVTVLGYADETGSRTYNDRLSLERATTVARALADLLRARASSGVLVHVVGAGTTTASPELSLNRRVDVIS